MRFLGRIFGANTWSGGRLECRGWKLWGGSLARAWVLEYAKIDRFLVRPYTPGDCMLGFDINPSDKV